jgi:hypothetical protein
VPTALLALLLTATDVTPSTTPGGARIVAQQARWTSLLAIDELSADGNSLFVISGTVRNESGAPLAHVRLVYELLAGDAVVASEYGYNRRAEALRDPRIEADPRAAAGLAIAPLPAGEEDLFRMAFLRGSTPRFDRWRVRIDAAPAATPP